MNLTEAELAHIFEKSETRNERLSLEEVMMYYYERPCRRVFPFSDDPVITQLNATRGSVIVKEEEVVVVCNSLDFHLLAPSPGFSFDFRSPSLLLDGTTLVTAPKGKVHVTYVYSGWQRARGLPIFRWGGEMLSGGKDLTIHAMLFTKSSYSFPEGHTRIMTCLEESSVLGSFAGERMRKALAP